MNNKSIRAFKINTDTWSMCFSNELCLFLLGDGHSMYLNPEFEETEFYQKHRYDTIDFVTNNIEIQDDRLFYHEWYTKGLYTKGDDGIIRFLDDVEPKLREKTKKKNYGVEASVIFETRVDIPEDVIEKIKERVKFFFDNFNLLLPFQDGPVKLTSIEFAEDHLQFEK